jgi:hypothetical protein
MVTTTREPGEVPKYEGTKEQAKEQKQRELDQAKKADEDNKDYWNKV